MSRKVLVTGATGLLGREVVKAFKEAGWEAVGTGHSRANPPVTRKLDILDSSAVSSILDEEKPQVIIHAAAERSPDKVENDAEAARSLNVDATKSLAASASSRGILVIYISTDYVFPGREGEAPYKVDAKTEPPNTYGHTKLDGEKATLEEAGKANLGIVLRIPVLYGKAEKNSESAVNVLMDSLERAQEKDAKVTMDDWSQRYPTNTEDVGRVCKDIATKYLESSDSERASFPKILQFTSEDRMTKYEITKLMADIMGLPITGLIANKKGNEPGASVQRPYDTHLSTKALKDLGIPVWTQDFEAWWKREVHAFRH